MGMGEPLLNYKNVIKALHYITSEEGLNMSHKRVTLSTSGITKMIKKLADDKVLLYSTVQIKNTLNGHSQIYTLVPESEADISQKKISISL